MTGGVLDALRDGIGRTTRAPAVLAGVWLLTTLVSLPLALFMRASIEDHLGASLEADLAASGVNYDWMQEFTGGGDAGVPLSPNVIGFAAVLDNLSAFLDNQRRPLLVTGAAAASLLLWIFLAGGIIDRYARARATGAHGFFSACGVFFFRFLRLAVLAGLAYAALFNALHPWLLERTYEALTRDVTVERTAFVLRLGLYALFGALLAVVNLLFDYAKVRAVVEDRRSMAGAVVAAARFLSRNFSAAVPLYLVNLAVVGAVLAVYAAVAPGAGSAGPSMWIGFAIGQAYVLGRIWTKLLFWSSETALFQQRLAHAGYVAPSRPAWPDSPSVEAVRRV